MNIPFGSSKSPLPQAEAFHAACCRIAQRHAPYNWRVRQWYKAFVLRQTATEIVTVHPPKELRGVNRRA